MPDTASFKMPDTSSFKMPDTSSFKMPAMPNLPSSGVYSAYLLYWVQKYKY